MTDTEFRDAVKKGTLSGGYLLFGDEDFLKNAVEQYGERIAVGVDIKDGEVAIKGWTQGGGINAFEFCRKLEKIGVKTIIYTDIATDGTLKGPNLCAMSEMCKNVSADVIASGGVGNIEHIKSLVPTGVEGVIVGRALYTENVKLSEAIKAVK